MIAELQLVFMVKNKNADEELGIAHTFKYIGAIV